MVIDKNYFLTRLANGEDMDTIGQEMAAMMNSAMAEHQAKIEAERAQQAAAAAQAEKEEAKRELIEELIEIVQELAILEGFEPDELQVTEEDMDQMVAAFTEMFNAMREVKKLVAALEDVKAPAKVVAKETKIAPTDEQILADFLKMFN